MVAGMVVPDSSEASGRSSPTPGMRNGKKEKPNWPRSAPLGASRGKSGMRFLSARFDCETRTSTSKTVVQNLNLFRRAHYATMLLDASDGIIFRDKGFCKGIS